MSIVEAITEWTGTISGVLWNNPITLIALLGTGVYLTFRMGFVQVLGFKHGVNLIRGKYSKPSDTGEISHFQALSTALSGTVGTGNIAGVATAIAVGGPGALFWMWVTAFLGMATKFTESTLSIRFREIDAKGQTAGGPMYTLLNGLNMKKTAMLFAIFALIASFGIGNMTQANSVVNGLKAVWPEVVNYTLYIGLAIAIPVGLVILGGVTRIAKAASTIVPFMAIVYITGALIVLFDNVTHIPEALATIFNLALNPWAAGGAAVGEAIRMGVTRGLFSNEAGLGSSAMAHAAAKTNEPVREGLVAMMEPFIDTIVICTLTGLVIVITGAYIGVGSGESSLITAKAFEKGMGPAGAYIVSFSLALFAFSTMLAWSYYGDRCARFIFGDKAVMPYRILYIFAIVIGASVPLKMVWNIADITNLLMALPNLIALVLLSVVVNKMRKDYFARMENQK